MDANQLLFWLKGHFDLSNEPPTTEAWGAIKAKVREAFPVEAWVVDSPPMHNPIHLDRSKLPPDLPCVGCKPAQT
jgi:hypothetical protein